MNGVVTQHMEYLPFGESSKAYLDQREKTLADEHLNSHNTPFKYNGKELDAETGFYYYGARYYDPRTSIFLSVDPLAEQTMTPYQYCYQNPINLIDPTGMEPEEGGDPNAVYISNVTGKLLGKTGDGTGGVRVIGKGSWITGNDPEEEFSEEEKIEYLNDNSQLITIDDAQIQQSLQTIHSKSYKSDKEYQIFIVLDTNEAKVKAILGEPGSNDECTIPGGKVQEWDESSGEYEGKKYLILAQAHCHPYIINENDEQNKTGSSHTLGGSSIINGWGPSGQDKTTAGNKNIPIYNIETHAIGPQGQASIGRVFPFKQIEVNVGKTNGSKGKTNKKPINIGIEALNYRIGRKSK